MARVAEERSRGGKIARRTFLVAASIVGGGLLVGAGTVAARLAMVDRYRLPTDHGEVSFGSWLRIAPDGVVEVAVPHQDMGQGIYALATQLTAEGLRLPIEAVRAVQAPIHARFANPTMILDGMPINQHVDSRVRDAIVWTFDKVIRTIGVAGTGGSTSSRNITEPIRACAASVLDMLSRAAAEKFGVSSDQLSIANGSISANGRSATYAELAGVAAKLSPRTITLPPLAQGVYLGKGAARADIPSKVDGTAIYGIDTREPGQLYAAILNSPRIGGVLQKATLQTGLPGVKGLVEGRDYVAVVASTYSKAIAALAKAEVVWDDSKASSLSTKDAFTSYREALDQGATYERRRVHDSAGDISQSQGRKISATYQAPFLAHAAMEPLNATALVTDNRVKVWAGHQSGFLAQMRAASAAGLPRDAVEIETPHLGGSFGRRTDLDYIFKAVTIARQFKGTPVQTIWSRAEDIRDDFYRPAALADVSATLDADGFPSSLVYRIAVPSVLTQFVGRAMAPGRAGGKPPPMPPDRSSVDGAIYNLYFLKNRSIESYTVDLDIPVGFWRSVGHSLNSFFFETFIDELSVQSGASPIDYRKRLLSAARGNDAADRAAIILAHLARYDADNKLVASAPTAKLGRGISLSECFHSFVGQLADVEVTGKDVRVKRVFAVVDCGFAMDPPNVVAQVRSGIIYGLSAALHGKVEIDNGRIVPKNFDTYPVLTLDNSPEIVVEIINSGRKIGGVGEIGTPGIAPAVGNAIFAATGRRLRSLPFTL